MFSSTINANYNNGASAMPGDYESWSRAAARFAPMRNIPPPQPLISPRSRPIQRPPQIPLTITRTSHPHAITTVTSERPRRRSRRRSVTPDIVIDRRHRHHSSSGRHRVMRIPLDYSPTLGLRGSPRRILEIERVRRRRHRKCRSPCYEHNYNIPPPPSLQPQLNNIVPNPYMSLAEPSLMLSPNNSVSSLAFISNLTPEILENLPKQTIHLPPIFLPGSQADANTELHTVVFPAEIINPLDGTLSVIQKDSARNDGAIAYNQPPVPVPSPSPSFDIPINSDSPLTSLPMLSGPFMQQVQDFFRRITLSATQSQIPSLPTVPQYNAPPNLPYNSQYIPTTNSTKVGFYPSANIRPTHTINRNTYNPTNIPPYRPANITPYHSANTAPYRPAPMTTAIPRNIAPYSPANITPYQMPSTVPPDPRNITPYSLPGSAPSRPLGPTLSNPPYARSNRASGTSSNFPDSGPYPPANITPYGAPSNHSPRSSALAPHIPSISLTSDSYNSSSAVMGNSPENIPHSSQAHAQTSHQSGVRMPRSILRNAPSNTTYARLSLPSSLSSKDIVRQTGTYL